MTTRQKAIIGATLFVALGTAVYEARQISTLRPQVQALQQQQVSLTGQIEELQRERDEAKSRLASQVNTIERMKGTSLEVPKLRAEVTQLRRDSQELAQLKAASKTNDAAEMELRAWFGHVKQLKQRLETNPNLQIPEFQLLTEEDWLDVARETRKPGIKPDPEFRIAMSELRRHAQEAFGHSAIEALRKYAAANNGGFPTDLSQLKPYFEVAVDDAILQRYTIAPRENTSFKDFTGLRREQWIITQKALVDGNNDYPIGITLGGVATRVSDARLSGKNR